MQKILKNEKGSISLFILLAALFFLVVVTGVGVSLKNKEAEIDAHFEKTKASYEKDAEQVYNEVISKNNSELEEQPDGTFKDSKGNEWVWIEVPKSVTASVTTDKDIYDALREYCNDVIAKTGTDYKKATSGFSDTWYSGCGLEEEEYNMTKSKMLNSIKDNGGFYIGKYETGIDDSSITEGATTTVGLRTSSGNTTQTAVIKQNKQPYTFVTCSQAESLAKGFAIDGKIASLLFGIQWDLVLKFLNVNGVEISLLNNDSITWGNYYNNTYNITNTEAWISKDNGANWTKVVHDKDSNGSTLLTTGAHISFLKQNIYDLAGNVWEWTLEQSSNSSSSCARRGGYYNYDGGQRPASYRGSDDVSYSQYDLGFRVALY